MKIFIYESVCAGDLGNDVPASLRREGEGMLAAVVADFQRLPGIEVITPKKVSGPFLSKKGPDTFFEFDWTIVIAPEFDDLLRDRSQAVLDAGGRLLGSLPGAIQLTGDKLATADFWKKRGIPHPRTQPLDRVSFASFAGPWVMKPRFGAGSQATFLIRNRSDELSAWSPAFHECPDRDFIVQQYIRGQAASVALLIGPAQTIALLPARQHLSRDGRFRYEGGSLPLPEPLASRALRLARQAVAGIDGLYGYVGVDLVLGEGEDGDDYAIEINPRLTASYLGLRQLCQQNLAELMLRLAQGEPIAPPSWNPGEVRFQTNNDP
jgi:predicted ATP-grasp superfamily ATP-dependent carboligase